MKLTIRIYWVATLLLSFIMLYSAQLYLLKTGMVRGFFESLGYPTYLVIPLAILKILGVVMILWRKNRWLTEWAYAGFFFDMLLATVAHYRVGDGLGLSFWGIPILLISYFLAPKARP